MKFLIIFLLSLPHLPAPSFAKSTLQMVFIRSASPTGGVAFHAQNHYGRIRNAVVITDSREPFNAGYMNTFEFGTFSGGGTADSVCRPNE